MSIIFACFGFTLSVFTNARFGIFERITVDDACCTTVGARGCGVDFTRCTSREVVAVGACCNDACAVLAIA